MKRIILLILSGLFLMSCHSNSPSTTNSHTVIDWVDFVKLNGTQYESVYSGVISSPAYIGEELGQVEFKVSDTITNPYYTIKDGDAAFWEKGTKLFAIKGAPEFIAIQDIHKINGYQIYYSGSATDEYNWHYKNIDPDTIKKIELYEGYSGTSLRNTLVEVQQITEFLNILSSGETKPSFTPNTSSGDPTTYEMVFYNDPPFAYRFPLFFDGDVWYFRPQETSIVPNEIEKFIIVED